MSETIDCRGKEQPTVNVRLLQETENTCPYCVDMRLSGDMSFSVIEVLDGNDNNVGQCIVHINDDGHAVITIYDTAGQPYAAYVVPKKKPKPGI